MSRNTKLFYCKSCEEMTFHSTYEHDEFWEKKYEERRERAKKEDYGSGYTMIQLF